MVQFGLDKSHKSQRNLTKQIANWNWKLDSCDDLGFKKNRPTSNQHFLVPFFQMKVNAVLGIGSPCMSKRVKEGIGQKSGLANRLNNDLYYV